MATTATLPSQHVNVLLSVRTLTALTPPSPLPCPFCASQRNVLVKNDDNFYNVQCCCGAEGPTRHSKVAAVQSWNMARR